MTSTDDPGAPLTAATWVADDRPVDDSGLAVGVQLGPYRLLSPLGSGGMGVVWLAERADGLYATKVAMKMLHPWLLQPSVRERFAREGRTLGRLAHPNIARLLDAGVDDHRLYLVLEYVQGERLDHWCDARRLDVEARIRLVMEVCSAVSAAHAALVVHRDLKPSNILVSDADGVKLLDFGIAKLIEADDTATEQTELSRVSGSPFTLEYAAPEQIAEGLVTTATDIHALGVILYQLLCGQRPFGVGATTGAEVQRAILHDDARPPSRVVTAAVAELRGASLSSLRKALTGDLDTIVAKALRKLPGERYGSVAEFAADLRRHLELRPIRARPESAAYRLSKYLRRNRVGVIAGAVVAVALGAGITVALWQAAEARAQARRADGEARVAIEEQQRSQRVTEFLMSMFTQEDPLRRKDRGPVTLAEAFDDALARVDTELKDDDQLRADLLLDFGEVRANQGDLDAAMALFRRALALAENSPLPARRQVIEALINIGVIEFFREHFTEALAPLERAIALLEQDPKPNPRQLMEARDAFATALAANGQLERAISLSAQVIETSRRLPDVQPLNLAVSIANQGTMLARLDRLDEADAALTEAIGMIERLKGADSASLVMALGSLSHTVFKRGDLARAVQLAERAQRIADASFKTDHGFKVAILSRLGGLRFEADQVVVGEQMLRESFDMAQRLGWATTDDVDLTLARMLMAMDQPQQARAVTAVGLKRCASLSNRDSDCLALLAADAEAQLEIGQAEAALTAIDTAIKAWSDRSTAAAQADALTVRAAALASLGRQAEAVVAQREALTLVADHRSTLTANDAIFALIERLAGSGASEAPAEAALALARIRPEPYEHRQAAAGIAKALTHRLQGQGDASRTELAAAIALLERHQPARARALRHAKRLLATLG